MFTHFLSLPFLLHSSVRCRSVCVLPSSPFIFVLSTFAFFLLFFFIFFFFPPLSSCLMTSSSLSSSCSLSPGHPFCLHRHLRIASRANSPIKGAKFERNQLSRSVIQSVCVCACVFPICSPVRDVHGNGYDDKANVFSFRFCVLPFLD